MKVLAASLVAACLSVSVTLAQTTTTPTDRSATTNNTAPDRAAASGDSNQAVATTSSDASTPAKGANSFTEGQAQSHLTDNGFSDVSALQKDSDGIWRGTAKKGGKQVSVWVDYKGNTGQQ